MIVEATFRRAADADTFAAAARDTPVWIICDAPPAVLLARAEARALRDSVSDAGPAIVAEELATYHGPFMAPGPALARLDTTHPTGELLAQLAAVLDSRLAERGERP